MSPGPSVVKAKAPAGSPWWLVPVLLVLSIPPSIFSVLRLLQLAGVSEVMPFDARFMAGPLPLVVHIVTALVFALIGPFQFVTGLRRRWPGWHRAAGRVLVVCGLLVGLSGLWMTLFYPRAEGTSDILFAVRLVFSTGMVAAIAIAFAAIRRGDVPRHRAWMIRGYTIGLGAGTQIFTGLAGTLVFGAMDAFIHDVVIGSAWVLNLAVAELILRRGRRTSRSGSRQPAVTG